MRGDTATKKRSRSKASLEAPSSDHGHLTRSKISAVMRGDTATKQRSRSKLSLEAPSSDHGHLTRSKTSAVMRGDTATKRRSRSKLSLEAPSSDLIHDHLTRLKTSAVMRGDTATKKRSTSKSSLEAYAAMRGDTAPKKRSRSKLSLEAPSSDHIHHLKKSKTSSALMNTINIDDLPDFLLVEILCRLPCNKSAFQCKLVNKSWCTLISNPYFIGRFVRFQMDKQMPIIRTLITSRGEEILPGILSPLFKRLMSFHGLKEEPVVVATYNDLVLCCRSKDSKRDYYICNPYTMQWVALPPPPPTQWEDSVKVGLICNHPYCGPYDDRKGLYNVVQVNSDFRCMVLRIVAHDQFYECCSNQLRVVRVQLFSFETGEWRESFVSSSYRIDGPMLHQSFAYNGMLYWSADLHGRMIGLDPFMMIHNTSSTISSNGDDVLDFYKCRIVDDLAVTTEKEDFLIFCLGVCGGCVRMCDYKISHGLFTLFVWELKEELQDHDDDDENMVVHGAGKFCVKEMRTYSLDENMLLDYDVDHKFIVELLGFDLSNEDILYLHIQGDFIKCNIRTREWSKLAAAGESKIRAVDHFFTIFPFVLPWWPTPVPRLPQHPAHVP